MPAPSLPDHAFTPFTLATSLVAGLALLAATILLARYSGFLQSSNVNAVEEMTAVLALSKQFELHVKMMNSAKEDDQAMTRVMQMS